MKYKQLNEISAVLMIVDEPCLSMFREYLRIYGYGEINSIHDPIRFDKFIKDAEAHGWIDWFVKYKYIEQVKEVKEVLFHRGQEFEHIYKGSREVYLLSGVNDASGLVQVSEGEDRGITWSTFVEVENVMEITEAEFDRITSDRSEDFKLIEEEVEGDDAYKLAS